MKDIDCRHADEHDLASRYLLGKLPEAQAEAFERHYFSCERCWGELDAAAEFRQTLGRPLVEGSESVAGGATRDYWSPLAAAAVVAVLAVGLGHLAERPEISPDRPVFRAQSADALDLKLEPGPAGRTMLAWRPHPNAESYRIEVLRSDGIPVLRSETSDVRLSLDVGSLPPLPPGVKLLAGVEALDILGQVVASSGWKTLPAP
jgi:hypothetical protein